VLEAKHSAGKTDFSVVKFSPNGNCLAVGFHENVIDVYVPLTLLFCWLIIHRLHF
jgi:predicted nucleotidyltransferase